MTLLLVLGGILALAGTLAFIFRESLERDRLCKYIHENCPLLELASNQIEGPAKKYCPDNHVVNANLAEAKSVHSRLKSLSHSELQLKELGELRILKGELSDALNLLSAARLLVQKSIPEDSVEE